MAVVRAALEAIDIALIYLPHTRFPFHAIVKTYSSHAPQTPLLASHQLYGLTSFYICVALSGTVRCIAASVGSLGATSLLLADLLQLAHLSLRSSLADDLDSVKAHGIRAICTLLYVYNEGVCLLELDVAQRDVGGSVGVPIALGQSDSLRRLSVISFVKVDTLSSVDIEVDDLRSRWGIVLVGRR